MSRSATPMSGALRPHTGHESTDVDHSGETPEYISTDEIVNNNSNKETLQRANSHISQSATYTPTRGGTLKKKSSLYKSGSVKRSASRRSSYAGSVRSMNLKDKDGHNPEDYNSAFYCPIPTTSSPTEILANRFQAWRRALKDLIAYFRDLHKSYDSRSKTLLSAMNVLNNTSMPTDFLTSGGISDANDILRDFHKQALAEAAKARDLENDVILQLNGLRSDLSQKIKEIKSLSGDFKNSVHKEQDGTRKAVNAFQEALGLADRDATAAAGKGDPFLMKLGVERQLEKQIEEENYLHRAYLNLEASGRELESIVVGEIQKAYGVLANILKRDADSSYDTAEKLRAGPLAMARDHEWDAFVTDNSSMVDPRQPLRQVKNITYEGKNHPAAIEVKSGMLERKSKYILSPTHLHEFKSADQIPFQAPVMSLYLPEQKLGSHSDKGSSSHKFMLKGRQTGSMHRGHTWIFRAETHDTMMAWFSDIRELTEKRGEARNEFVRRTHARSLSASSQKAPSVASGDSQMDEDEADKIAFAGEESVRGVQLDQSMAGSIYGTGETTAFGTRGDDTRSEAGWRPPQRPQPGGRFPSEVNVTRGLQEPLSPSSGDSGEEPDRDVVAAATALPGSALPAMMATSAEYERLTQPVVPKAQNEEVAANTTQSGTGYTVGEHTRVVANPQGAEVAPETQSQYHEWIGATGAGLAGATAGSIVATAVATDAEKARSPESAKEEMSSVNPAIPPLGHSSVPIVTTESAATESGIYGANEPTHITASAYQKSAMLTAEKEESVDLSDEQRLSSNGNLISGTDIRAPIGTEPVPIAAQPKAAHFAATVPSESVIRPMPIHTKSVQTISDLHIPGEFPKSAGTPTGSA